MAKMGSLPSKEVIGSYKGTIDFYYWMGIPVCRKWPSRPKMPQTSPSKLQSEQFANINIMAKTVDASAKPYYIHEAVGTGLTWKDVLTRLYLHGIDYVEV